MRSYNTSLQTRHGKEVRQSLNLKKINNISLEKRKNNVLKI